MGKMGKYCKAYPIQQLREFSRWRENHQNTRKEKTQVDGKEVEANRQLTDTDYLYLQENFVVTDGIFLDENIIFEDESPEWIDFCKTSLKFEVPVYAPVDRSETGKADPGVSAQQS